MEITQAMVDSANTKANVLSQVKQLKETTDIEEVAKLLNTGEWIAIFATNINPYTYSLGKII